MLDITLYQYEISPFCEKVRRILNYKQQTYSCENITLLQSQLGKTKKLGVAGKLPALKIGTEMISDSTDIAYRLEALFPEKSLIPTNKKQQAHMHFFEDWADESLYFYEVYLRFAIKSNQAHWGKESAKYDHPAFAAIAKFVAPKVLNDVANKQGIGRKDWATVEKDLNRHLSSLEDWLEDESFLVADKLSLADIAVFSQLHCMLTTPQGQAAVSQYSNIQRWMKNVDQLTSSTL